MSAFVSVLNLGLLVIGNAVYIPVIYFVFRRRLFKQLAFLTIYIYAQIPRDLILNWLNYWPPLGIPYFVYIHAYFYWITAIILSFLRILAIAEIGKNILCQSPAVRKL